MAKLKFKVTDHSDNISEGSVFFIFRGKNNIGSDFIKKAYKKGCRHFVFKKNEIQNYEEIFSKFEEKVLIEPQEEGTCLRELYSHYCKKYYNDIQKNLNIYGVTGTKGKSSTTIFFYDILKKSKKKIALISGIKAEIKNKKYKVNLTTPKPDFLWAFFQKAFEEGITDIIIEVSAQALTLKRIFGISFKGIIFTNFSKDHGEFYKTEVDYLNAKILFLDYLKDDAFILINFDDEKFKNSILEKIKKNEKNFKIKFYSNLYKKTDFTFFIEKLNYKFSEFKIYDLNNKKEYFFKILFDSEHFIYNFLGAFSLYKLIFNPSENEILKISKKYHLKKIFVPGRGNKYFLNNGINIYIDLAHSISSFEIVLKNLRTHTENLIVIFGCGGEKEIEKRPAYAEISEKYCDKIFVTEDNPRNEDLKKINNDILSGFNSLEKVSVIENREEAIKIAINSAKKNSIVAILGKGFETYQIRKNKKIKHSDLAIIKQNFTLI